MYASARPTHTHTHTHTGTNIHRTAQKLLDNRNLIRRLSCQVTFTPPVQMSGHNLLFKITY